MTTFSIPLTPSEFATVKADLIKQKAKISGPDTALAISKFHDVDFLGNYTAPVPPNAKGSLQISIVKKHGLSELASDEDVQKKVGVAIAQALGQTT
jgi:hypothetical protein